MRIDTLVTAAPVTASSVGTLAQDTTDDVVYFNKDGTAGGWAGLNDGVFGGDVSIAGFLNVGSPSVPADAPGEAAFAGDVFTDGTLTVGGGITTILPAASISTIQTADANTRMDFSTARTAGGANAFRFATGTGDALLLLENLNAIVGKGLRIGPSAWDGAMDGAIGAGPTTSSHIRWRPDSSQGLWRQFGRAGNEVITMKDSGSVGDHSGHIQLRSNSGQVKMNFDGNTGSFEMRGLVTGGWRRGLNIMASAGTGLAGYFVLGSAANFNLMELGPRTAPWVTIESAEMEIQSGTDLQLIAGDIIVTAGDIIVTAGDGIWSDGVVLITTSVIQTALTVTTPGDVPISCISTDGTCIVGIQDNATTGATYVGVGAIGNVLQLRANNAFNATLSGAVFTLPTVDLTVTVGKTTLGGDLVHTGTKLGFYATASIVKQTGVAVTAAGVHAALVNLGLIAA